MSTVLDYARCPQCGFEQADAEYNCRTCEDRLQCRRCGYCEFVDREIGDDGTVTYKDKSIEGAGVLFYRGKDAIAYVSHYIPTQEEVTRAEVWLRTELGAGSVCSESAYLTRWNPKTKTVEYVIGTFYEVPPYDEKEIKSHQSTTSVDLRPFQLVEKMTDVVLRYNCGHTAAGRLLLLIGQKEPSPEAIFEAKYLCRACSSTAADPEGDHREGESSLSHAHPGNWFWENGALDGRSNFVTPAFIHPENLEESASLLYAAYPERKRTHPQSIGFRLQLEGWSDEEITEKKWLSSPDGTKLMEEGSRKEKTGLSGV